MELNLTTSKAKLKECQEKIEKIIKCWNDFLKAGLVVTTEHLGTTKKDWKEVTWMIEDLNYDTSSIRLLSFHDGRSIYHDGGELMLLSNFFGTSHIPTQDVNKIREELEEVLLRKRGSEPTLITLLRSTEDYKKNFIRTNENVSVEATWVPFRNHIRSIMDTLVMQAIQKDVNTKNFCHGCLHAFGQPFRLPNQSGTTLETFLNTELAKMDDLTLPEFLEKRGFSMYMTNNPSIQFLTYLFLYSAIRTLDKLGKLRYIYLRDVSERVKELYDNLEGCNGRLNIKDFELTNEIDFRP